MTSPIVEADVVVVGAGPAGCAAALELRQSGCRVVVVDATSNPGPSRIGECLPAAANRLLRKLGVWQQFIDDGHLPCHARTSRWGAAVHTQDAIADLDGAAWLLDRNRFDQQLRSATRASGVQFLSRARVASVTRHEDRWLMELATGSGASISARVLIDAAGAASRLSESSGLARLSTDRLVCAWTRLSRSRPGPALTYVETSPHGWWYTAPVPGGHRVVAFHTDSDVARQHKVRSNLIALAHTCATLREQATDSDWRSAEPIRICRASSARLPSPVGPNRVTVGDASMTFDPISGQGLFHALYSGLYGGRAALGWLNGDARPADRFAAELESIWKTYRVRHIASYQQEPRWPEEPFWKRRRHELRDQGAASTVGG